MRHPRHLRELPPVLKLIAQDTHALVKEAQLSLIAANLAYTTLLSVVPLAAVTFAIFKAFGGTEKIQDAIQPFIVRYLAEGTSDDALRVIHGYLDDLKATTLGITGMAAVVLTSMAMLYRIETAINRIWKAQITRQTFHRITAYWFVISLGPLGAAFAVGAWTSSETATSLAQYLPARLLTPLLVIGSLFAVYRWVPNRRVNWTPPLLGAVVTALLLKLAQWGYQLYTRHFVSFDQLYGSIAAFPVILIWIYILWLIILSGAALSAAFQKRLDLK